MKFIISKLVSFAIRLLSRTVSFEFADIDNLTGDKVIGFWHGDTQAALMLLHRIGKRGLALNTVVTTKWRGDSLSDVIRRFGHNPLRTSDGMGIRKNIEQLKEAAEDKTRSFAMAMDGPLGPRHEPKKFLFRLAADAGREVVVLKVSYKRVIRLNRWDNYVILLPFSKIEMSLGYPGIPTRDEVKNFTHLRERILRESGIET